MRYDEFTELTKATKAKGAIIALLKNARVCSIQLHNAQVEFEKNDIKGFVPDTIKQINEEHCIVENTVEALYDLLEVLGDESLSHCRWIIRELLIDYQHGNFEFEGIE